MTEEKLNNSLSGFNALLMGPAGTGKTHAIGTLVDSGLEVFFLAIETGIESLSGYFTDQGKAIPPNLHWHLLEAPRAGFDTLMESAKRVNTLTFEVMCKANDPKRSDYDQCYKLLSSLNNFVDDRTGQSYGDVSTWGTDRVLVIDGLSGMATAYMDNVVGGRPAIGLQDWLVAQRELTKVLRMICDWCRCHFVLIGHVERETDPVSGATKIMVSSLGKSLSPKIPAIFSDVILTVREGSKWYWDTSSSLADLKTRNLPIATNIKPDFRLILEKWKSRQV